MKLNSDFSGEREVELVWAGYGGDSDFEGLELRDRFVAFSTGHPKDHHQPTDTADKLDYRNVRDIARLAFAMAWEIASGERKIGRIISE